MDFIEFLCQVSWILASSRVLLNDDIDSEREVRYKALLIEVWWCDFNSPFLGFLWLSPQNQNDKFLPAVSQASLRVCVLYMHQILLL